ncbi:MAG: hypothetical protein RL522_1193 [Pseudomonadota bacterium]|jgi:hypothetical protein
MSDSGVGFGGKLENAFLAILRVVILLVLAISLIAAVGFAVYGVKDLGASEESYKPEKVDSKALLQELRKSLEDGPAAAPAAPASSKPGAPKAETKALDEELSKQLKTVSDFLAQFQKNLSNPEGFKASLRRKATTLAVEPQNEASVLAYAKGQTEFFTLALTDKDIITALQKKEDGGETFGKFFNTAVELYPEFFEKQREERKAFERRENARVAGAKAGAMMKLYAASGLFGAFLLVSLILVLVKIERNLRARPI